MTHQVELIAETTLIVQVALAAQMIRVVIHPQEIARTAGIANSLANPVIGKSYGK